MLGSLTAILLLVCAQWTLGLYLALLVSIVNAGAYAYLLLSTKFYATTIKVQTISVVVLSAMYMTVVKLI